MTGRTHDVFVSVTTVPWRVRFLGAVLDNLLAQTFTDFDVHVYVPSVCKRTNEAYDVPGPLLARFENEPRLRLRRIPTDYGPATKLLAAYAEAHEARAIITVDDDVLLERHAVEELVDATSRYPGDAVGFMGVSGDQYVHAEMLAARGLEFATPSVLGGYRGILYPLPVLDATLFDDYERVSEQCEPFLDDDHLFAWNLARRGVTRRVIATAHPGPGHVLNLSFLDLPGPITGGADGGAAVDRSHRALARHYERNDWDYPR